MFPCDTGALGISTATPVLKITRVHLHSRCQHARRPHHLHCKTRSGPRRGERRPRRRLNVWQRRARTGTITPPPPRLAAGRLPDSLSLSLSFPVCYSTPLSCCLFYWSVPLYFGILSCLFNLSCVLNLSILAVYLSIHLFLLLVIYPKSISFPGLCVFQSLPFPPFRHIWQFLFHHRLGASRFLQYPSLLTPFFIQFHYPSFILSPLRYDILTTCLASPSLFISSSYLLIPLFICFSPCFLSRFFFLNSILFPLCCIVNLSGYLFRIYLSSRTLLLITNYAKEL